MKRTWNRIRRFLNQSLRLLAWRCGLNEAYQYFSDVLFLYFGIRKKAVELTTTELVHLNVKRFHKDFNLIHFEFQSKNEGLEGMISAWNCRDRNRGLNIILADTLGCFHNPDKVLKKLKNRLKTGGSFLCSIPNFMHVSVLHRLLLGEFEYQNQGIFGWKIFKIFYIEQYSKVIWKMRDLYW